MDDKEFHHTDNSQGLEGIEIQMTDYPAQPQQQQP